MCKVIIYEVGMVNSITPQQLQALQQLQAINFGQGNTNLLSQKAEGDSFNGKTLLTIAGIAGAVIFRKNIAGFVAKHFPKLAGWCKSNISKPIKDFMTKNKSNCVIKFVRKAEAGFLKLERKCTNFLAGLFGKGGVNNAASAKVHG